MSKTLNENENGVIDSKSKNCEHMYMNRNELDRQTCIVRLRYKGKKRKVTMVRVDAVRQELTRGT